MAGFSLRDPPHLLRQRTRNRALSIDGVEAMGITEVAIGLQ